MKRSIVWRYFEKVDDKKAVCEKCGDTIVTSGNTSNLFKVDESVIYVQH